ncbi:hypothetical protein MBLNU457_4773t1 [Dothideomycetes sp. NU457]
MKTVILTSTLLTAAQVIAAPLSPCGINATEATGAWDYIVVGSGAGGIPVAAQLAASGKRTLLLERGPPSSGRWTGEKYGGLADPNWKPSWLQDTNLTFYDVPGLYTEIFSGNFSSDIYCQDVQGAIAGCVLGGGTAINAGLWWKPAKIDWDYVFPANSGWSSSDMQNATDSVFGRIPGVSVPSTNGQLYLQQGAHVIEGALEQASWTREVSNETPDQRTQKRVFTNTTFMYQNGERGGPMATYLVEAVQRPNFQIWTNTEVERVQRDGGRATGVVVKSVGAGGHDGVISVSNTGGVVLSAGAYGSPKILFRSGIGPQDQLNMVKRVEGESMVDESQWISLPVGYNLADNINTDIVITQPNVANFDWIEAYHNPPASAAEEYRDNKTGILTQCGSNLNPMLWEPVIGMDGYYRQLQWTARVASSLGVEDTNGTAMTVSNYLGLGQVTRGRTTINEDLTMVVSQGMNIQQNAADRAAIVQGVEDLRSVLANITNLTIVQPAPEVSSSDCVDQTEHAPVNHWLGTCKLGVDDGRYGGQAVVDPDTKVYGMDNLFVVDGSIFPGLTTANPSAAIVVAAERAAQRILAL